jgi:hypothetical protein
MTGWQPQGYDPRQQQRPAVPDAWADSTAGGGYRGAPPAAQPQFRPAPYPPQPQYAPQQYAPPAQRKKRRVFLWVFLAVQALFLIWLIAGVAGTSHSGSDAHTQAVQWCAVKGNWQFLYKSQADCVTHYGNALNGASDVGKSLGVGVIVIFWVVVDFFLGLGYGIYRLASRR